MAISPKRFANQILAFYDEHGRKDLPWQQNPTPYRVWVSEIMLQQTQVKTVIPYYEKFMGQFPDVNSLAKASVDDVLNYWQGLGYYSRARNLHKCAQQVVNNFSGKFPDNLHAMESLPGIGRSTAGAILSLSMDKSTPILDGNVKRVIARVFLVDGWYGQAKVAKALWELTEKYTPKNRTGHFNQAMMDLGASLCSRTKPQCDLCPLEKDCQANLRDKTAEYPHKKPKKEIPEKSAIYVLAINEKMQVLLNKRPPTGIWGGLWVLPEHESLGISLKKAKDSDLIDDFRHTFTHFHLNIRVVLDPQKNTTNQLIAENNQLAWHNIHQLDDLALPTPIRKFFNRYLSEPQN